MLSLLVRTLDYIPRRKPVMLRKIPDSTQACIATVLNDEFLEYFFVLLYSIRKHNPWFHHDILIFWSKKFSPLSEENREKIRASYPQVSFQEVEEDRHLPFLKHTPARLLPALFKLEPFRIMEYDTVVCIDSDIVCLGDISALFTTSVDFGACMAGKDAATKEKLSNTHRWGRGFNSGVMVIGKKYRTEKIYNTLFTYQSGPCGDQEVLNAFFRSKPVYYFDHTYNYHAQFFWNEKTSDDVRLLHFAGQKPLANPELPRMRIWFQYYREMQAAVPLHMSGSPVH